MIALLAGLLLAGSPPEKALKADLLVTNQPGTIFFRMAQGKGFELPNVTTARRGEPIAALVLFSGCAPDKQGNCDVRMDQVVLGPTGKVYGESKDMEVWVGKPPPAAYATQLGVGYLMIRIEPRDPPGKYRIKAHITDHVAGSVLDREWSSLRLRSSPPIPRNGPPGSRSRTSPVSGRITARMATA